jgi:hypothetical protein
MAGTVFILDAKETRLVDAYRKGGAAQAQLTAKTLEGARKQNAALNKTAREVRRVGTEAQTAGGKMSAIVGTKAVDKIKSMAAGFFGAGGVIAGVKAATAAWENFNETIEASSTAIQTVAAAQLSLAVLQEPGMKRANVERFQGLMGEFGVKPEDRGKAADMLQSLQSAAGVEQGFQMAREALRAQQVGVPIEVAQSLEMKGQAFGMDPGEMTRKAFVAGKLSPSRSEIVSKVDQALPYWDDPTVAMAVTAAMSGVHGEEVGTFAKGVGTGLSELKPMFAQVAPYFGTGVATDEVAQLQFLRLTGVDTAEEFKQLGVGNQRAQAGLTTAVKTLDTTKKILKELDEGAAAPGVLDAERAQLEKEIPEYAFAREMDSLAARRETAIATGGLANERSPVARRRAVVATAATELGLESKGVVKVVEGTGTEAKTTVVDLTQLAAQELAAGALGLRNGQPLPAVSPDATFGERFFKYLLPDTAAILDRADGIERELKGIREDMQTAANKFDRPSATDETMKETTRELREFNRNFYRRAFNQSYVDRNSGL